jgi:chromosome segregation ATPase
MSEQKRGEITIKDLLIKLQVLSNGLIEERKKSQGYLNRIKEYEESIQNKDSEIVDLTKEKFELKSKLTLERSKTGDSNRNEYTKLVEKFNQQKFEIKDLSQRVMEEKESYDQQKIKFQTMITLQDQQIAELKKNLQNVKTEVPKVEVVSEEKEKMEALTRKFNLERDQYEGQISKAKNELNEEKEKIETINKKLLEYKNAFDTKNIENKNMKNQIGDLNNQIKNLKQELHNKQLSPRMFQVEKIKDGVLKNKKVMTITFRWNKDKNRCEVVFKRMKHGGKIKEDIVNITDISQFRVSDKKKETIDIVFFVSFYF